MDMKRFFLYAIVIAALALAGCGGNGGGMAGSGDDGNGDDGNGTTPGTTTPAAVTVPMLPMGYNSNPAGMLTVAAGDTMDHGDVTYSCAAGGADCMITVAADGSVTSTGGMATAARSMVSIDQETEDGMAAAVAATKAAGTKETAIATELGQQADAGLGGSARSDTGGTTTEDDSSDDPYTLEISRDFSGTTIKITDPAQATPEFAQAKDLGGGTTMHVRAMAADPDGNVEEEVVMVTTDIGPPKRTAFDKVMGQELNANAQGNPVTGVAAVGFDPGDELAITNDEHVAILEKIKSDSFAVTTSNSAVLTFNAAVSDNTSTTDIDETKEASEIMGTYNGAEGTYKCTGTANCTVTANNMGKITAFGNGWVFFPASDATSIVDDADYLYYGFWLKKTTDKDSVLTYDEVETFAGSSIAASDGGQLDSVTGSATYNGGATGVYVKNNISTDGTVESATSGHFTATASLTAHFSQTVNDTTTEGVDEAGRLRPNMLNTITGTINNFMLAGGEENKWSVALKGNRADGGNTFSGTASGGVAGIDGKLSGTYHGLTPDTESDGDGSTKVAPGAVVGEFNSVFSNGSVAGAFGARKQQ